MRKSILASVVAVTAAMAQVGGTTAAVAGQTFDAIKKRGELICGVNTGLGGFSNTDSKGRWIGLDVDVCRAVSAAIFGSGEKVKFVPLNASQRFTALQTGEIDVLSRNTTWTLTRDSEQGLNFAAVTFYDGQGFMVPKKLGVKSAKELDGASICVQQGTTTELNLSDYFRSTGMSYKPVVIDNLQEILAAFFANRCDVFTADASALAAIRVKNAPQGRSDDYLILPEIISKEPLGPAVRHGDDQLFDIVKWTIFALIEAEEMGITQANVDQMAKESKNPSVLRLLGVNPGFGKALGLDEAWAVNAIKATGNYGEIWERNIKPLGLDRGLNQIWKEGGMMYAPPAR
ncbi:MAG: hypothetical protein RLZ98_2725 [Pseudomonadota bacterium]|jgi:general L-amino acid transport system substrate-binding protein